LPSQGTGPLDATATWQGQPKSTEPIAVDAETGSITGQLQETEMKTDSVQGSIGAGA